jgi:mono/diheme cytochrome c family protein
MIRNQQPYGTAMQSTNRTMTWLAAGFLGTVGLMALAATAAFSQNTPAAMQLPAGPGRDLVATNCAQCHALGLALGKRREGSILCISDGSGCTACLIQDPVSQAWLQSL